MSSSPSLCAEKKRWWVSNRKVVARHVKDARSLMGTQEPCDVQTALGLLEKALALSPRHEEALELKARSLLYLRRFRDVADMLQDYIPSFRCVADLDDSSTSLSSDNSSSSAQSQQLSREKAKLLPSSSSSSEDGHTEPDGLFRCFSVADLKRRMLAGLYGTGDTQGPWRYMVLGKACSHLGMMEDAMVLLQTGRRLATAASRRESRYLSDDDFSFSSAAVTEAPPSASSSAPGTSPAPAPPTESESAAHLLSHIKFLLRRRAAAVAALDAGLPSESVRHFSKILDGRRGTPHPFAAGCLVGRAAAYRAAGRIAESIADCNRALALEPTSIPALRARADLLESVRSYPDCLRDLDHLKLLYDAILRDRKLPGPAWRPFGGARYRDVPGDLRALTSRIQALRQSVARGEACCVDYHALMGVRRGCTRSELERAHLLLSLKHRPDKAAAFIERLEFADEHRDMDAVRDQAKMSALVLYRLLQKGYSSIMSSIMDEEAAEKQRLRVAAALQAAASVAGVPAQEVGELPQPKAATESGDPVENGRGQREVPAERASVHVPTSEVKVAAAAAASVFQGVFCRDLATVGDLLSQAGFNRTIPVKYEAMSC
uniref:DnaJ subfamily C member 7 n=2 Tax=Anthurium amnicola TaxID=1678845 RepID=A0A1D1Y9K0_9ARAE